MNEFLKIHLITALFKQKQKYINHPKSYFVLLSSENYILT